MERDATLYDVVLVLYMHFNSHAHVERDSASDVDSYCTIISTHTLTWSVTSLSLGSTMVLAISTHTLTWSVTHL